MSLAGDSPDGLLGEPVEQRPGLGPEVKAASVAVVPLEVLEVGGPGVAVGPGDKAEDLLEEGLVAGDGEGPVVGEPVLLLRLDEELPEDGVVQVRRPHHEPPAPLPHAHYHVTRRHVGRDAGPPFGGGGCRGRPRLAPPPPQHLPQPHDVADLAAFPDSGRHFLPRKVIESSLVFPGISSAGRSCFFFFFVVGSG